METKTTFEVQEIVQDNVVTVKDYTKVFAVANDIVNAFELKEVTTDAEKKVAKDFRANCNKAVKAIDRARIDGKRAVTEAFEEQCNSLADIFERKAKEVDDMVKKYEEEQKLSLPPTPPKPKMIKAILSFYDETMVDKIKKFAEENKLGLEVK